MGGEEVGTARLRKLRRKGGGEGRSRKEHEVRGETICLRDLTLCLLKEDW